MKQRIRKCGAVLAVLLFVLVCLQAGAYAADSSALLKEVRSLIRDSYYRDVDEKVFRQNTVEATIQALGDPYSEYFTKEEYQEFMEGTNGTYAGVGMEMKLETYGGQMLPTVVSTFNDSPARTAGLLSGDRIIAVDGKDIAGYGLEYVVSIIKGVPGSTVSLTIDREGIDAPFTVRLTREVIRLQMVTYEMQENSLGYINAFQFSNDSGLEVRKAVKALMAQGAKGIILDLRNNPGGFLDAGLDMAEVFVPNGKPVVHYRSKLGTETSYSDGFPIDIPLAVLVNGDSASASEIVAGAIKDYGAGTLVGTTTYGKGTVQTILELNNPPYGALKLTIAEYLSPKGSQINGKGVTPDIAVEGAAEQLEAAKKVLLEKLARQNSANDTLFLYPDQGEAYLDGKKVAGSGKPFLSRGVVMVPLRLLSDFLEGSITWNNADSQAFLKYGDSQAAVSVGADYAVVGTNQVKLNSPVKVVEGRICVPLRLLASFQGITVDWDPVLNRAEVRRK